MSEGAHLGRAANIRVSACGCVSMSTEAKKKRTLAPTVFTRIQMIEAVRSELSCDSGTVSAVARVIYEPIRHHQPLSGGGGRMVSSIISSPPPHTHTPFHNPVLCSDLLSSRLPF